MLAVIFVVSLSFWCGRKAIFLYCGKYLLESVTPERSDVIVVLRGDTNFSRILTAAQLLQTGYSESVYISTALIDKSINQLKVHGVELPSEQERLKSILIQLGIHEEKIVVGHREPGGGTLGEIKRIRAMMIEQGFKKAIIVTSWYHTRRTNTICKRAFEGTDIRIFVVAARNDISNPINWWKYRYEAIHVMGEFPKLAFLYLGDILNISFSDDPISIQAMHS